MTLRRTALITANLILGIAFLILRIWPNQAPIAEAGSFPEIAWTDLMQNTRGPAFATPAPGPVVRDVITERTDFHVVGILINGDRKMAVVLANRESLPQRIVEGAEISGRKVIRINPRSIEVDEAGNRLELALDPPRSAP